MRSLSLLFCFIALLFLVAALVEKSLSGGKLIRTSKGKVKSVKKSLKRKKTATTITHKIVEKKTGSTPVVSKSVPPPLKIPFFDEYSRPDNEVGTSCYDACFPNATLLDEIGQIRNPSQFGKLRMHCGKTYLMGKKKVSWEENWRTCCALGMMPIILDTPTVSKCIGKIYGNPKSEQLRLEGDRSFWTGGHKNRPSSQPQFVWCSKNWLEELSINNDVLLDRENNDVLRYIEKYSTEDEIPKLALKDFQCIRSRPSTITEFVLDRCDSKTGYMACESVEKTSDDNIVAPNSNCKTKCDPNTCVENVNFGKQDEQQELTKNALFAQGKWIASCGQYFYVSINTASQEEAHKTCCSLGANLLSIKSSKKRTCLSSIIRNSIGLEGAELWTSGTQKGCDGNFRWCSVDRAFREGINVWAKGHPAKDKGDCVIFKRKERSSYLKTEHCFAKKRFVCEFSGFGTSVAMIHKKCTEILGLTVNEVRDLSDVSKFTYKMKINYDGSMNANEIVQFSMAYLEKKKDDYDYFKLQKTINKCAEIIYPNDDCENTFRMFKCVIEEEPLLYTRVWNWEVEEKVLVLNMPTHTEPRSCYCAVSNNCAESKSLKRNLQLSKNISIGTSFLGWNNATWFKSLLKYDSSYSFDEAYTTCCHLGMRLPIANTLSEIQQTLDALDGNITDTYFGETYSSPSGEYWCSVDKAVDPMLSGDGFKLLQKMSVFVARKDSDYKLIAVLRERLAEVMPIHQFLCQPIPLQSS